MTNRVTDLPKNPEVAGKLIDAEHAHALRLAEMGAIGGLMGSRENASLYLSAGVVVLALVGAVILAVCQPDLRADTLKGVFVVATTALGYFLASGGAKARD